MANVKLNVGDNLVKIETNGAYNLSIEIGMEEEEFLRRNDLRSEEEFKEVSKELDRARDEISDYEDSIEKLDAEIEKLQDQIKQLELQISKLED